MMSSYSSRKFIVAISSMVITTILSLFGKMNGDVASVFLAINVGYPAANAIIKGKQNGKIS